MKYAGLKECVHSAEARCISRNNFRSKLLAALHGGSTDMVSALVMTYCLCCLAGGPDSHMVFSTVVVTNQPKPMLLVGHVRGSGIDADNLTMMPDPDWNISAYEAGYVWPATASDVLVTSSTAPQRMPGWMIALVAVSAAALVMMIAGWCIVSMMKVCWMQKVRPDKTVLASLGRAASGASSSATAAGGLPGNCSEVHNQAAADGSKAIGLDGADRSSGYAKKTAAHHLQLATVGQSLPDVVRSSDQDKARHEVAGELALHAKDDRMMTGVVRSPFEEAATMPSAQPAGTNPGWQQLHSAITTLTHDMTRRRLQASLAARNNSLQTARQASGSVTTPETSTMDSSSQHAAPISNAAPPLSLLPAVRTNSSPLQLVQEIGRGSFASVYKALWRGRVVAVKLVQLPCSGNDARQQAAARMAVMETVVTTTMSHPNIVQVYTYNLKPLGSGTSSDSDGGSSITVSISSSSGIESSLPLPGTAASAEAGPSLPSCCVQHDTIQPKLQQQGPQQKPQHRHSLQPAMHDATEYGMADKASQQYMDAHTSWQPEDARHQQQQQQGTGQQQQLPDEQHQQQQQGQAVGQLPSPAAAASGPVAGCMSCSVYGWELQLVMEYCEEVRGHD